MRVTDAPVAAAYRALPDVARYQDWDLPYTLERAHDSVRKQDDLHDVTAGRWVSIAIEREGDVIGDLALGLDADGNVGTLGYTLAPEHQGRGHASEAAAALVDALFEQTTVHRVMATIDPENHASMRLLEQLGFQFEGVLRRGALVRGEWLDDAVFGLLRDDRLAWRTRERSRPGNIELVELNAANDLAYRRLRTHHFQERFVAPVIRSLADAMLPDVVDGAPLTPWFRGVNADGIPAAFVMITQASAHHPHPYLWRLLVDRRQQRRGIGTMVLSSLIAQLRDEGHARLLVSYVDAPGGPKPLYERFGFVPTGEIDDGEVVAALQL